jgi:hypothetical protein
MGGWKIVKYIMSHKCYDLQHMVFKKNCDQYFKNSIFWLENWQILFVFKNVTTMITSQTLLTKALVQKEVEIDELGGCQFNLQITKK